MFLGGSIDLEEEVTELSVLAQHEVRVGGDAAHALSLFRDRDMEPSVLSLVPGHELGFGCLAEREFQVAPEVRGHQVVFEEPLCPAGIVLLPTDRFWFGPGRGCRSGTV